jgi:thioredoxin:protein disulfide reductase
MSKTFIFVATILLSGLVPAVAGAAPSGAIDVTADGWLWAFALAFGWGFATSLTPCVYPMLPIVVGIFGARDQSVGRRKAFLLAMSYVAGMGLLYSVLGVLFALLGKQFGQLLGNPWVVIPMVLFYTALAASMFGAFDISLPQGLQQRLTRVGGRGFRGAFGLGLVGGLTAAPCTGPFLAGIIIFIANSGNAPAGFFLMYTYALGMSVLIFPIAVFAASLPRSGAWMEAVKSVGGIALLVVGIYFLRPVVPAIARLSSANTGFLAGALALAAAGFAAGAAHLSFHGPWPERVRKGIAVGVTVVGLSAAVNWALTPKHPIAWLKSEPAALAAARDQDKGVLIDFSADWCAPCKELEKITFSDPAVHADINQRFVPLKVDLTNAEDEASQALQTKYNAPTLPAVVLLDSSGKEVTRVVSFVGPDEFLAKLRLVQTAGR